MNKVIIHFDKISLKKQSVDVTISRDGKFFRKNPELLEPTPTTIYLKEPDPEIVIEIDSDPSVNIKLGNVLEKLLDRFEKVMSQQTKVSKLDSDLVLDVKSALDQAHTVMMGIRVRDKVISNASNGIL